MRDARQVQFWIGALALTAINFSVWFLDVADRPDGPSTVRIAFSTSAEAFAKTGRLMLELDRDLYSDSQIGLPIERSPFRIEPPIAGDWMTVSAGMVAFEPHEPPSPGRIYRVALASTHPMFRHHAIDESTLPTIRYEPLDAEGVRLKEVWRPTADKDARRARIEVEFNQPVDRSDLEEALVVSIGGREVDVAITSDRIESIHRFTIPCSANDIIDVMIREDLAGDGGVLSLSRPVRRTFRIAGHLRELRTTTGRGYDGRPWIQMHFDRMLAAGQTVPSIVVDPPVDRFAARIHKQRIYLNGDFRSNRTYAITLEAPLLAEDGSVLRDSVMRSVTFEAPPPVLAFHDRSSQISPEGRFEVAIRHDQVEAMRVTVDRLLDRNIPMLLADVLSTSDLARLSKRVVDRTVEMQGDPTEERWTSRLDLESLMERTPGLYHLEISNPDVRWMSERQTLLVSDLAIETQVESDGVLVWVTEIDSGRPVEGAEVTAWAPDQSEIARLVSDDRGIVRIRFEGRACDLVSATAGSDLTYVRLATAAGIDDATLRGRPWSGPIDLALYADRGVHRPGETIHLTGIAREADGRLIPSTPLEIRWTRPDGRRASTRQVMTGDRQGVFHCDVSTDAASMTGTWLATAHLPGDDAVIGRLECPVMPFLPIRLNVESKIAMLADEPDSKIEIDVDGRYLHGGPASGLATTLTMRFDPVTAKIEGRPELTFEPIGDRRTIRRLVRGRLGPDGKTRLSVKPPEAPGAWRMTSVASVFELGGRATASTIRGRIDTARRHLGLGLPAGRVYRPDEVIAIQTLPLLDGEFDESIVPTITIESVEERWQRVRGRNWTRTRTVHPVGTTLTEPILLEEGGTSRELPALPVGTYRVRASMQTPEGVEITTSREFHVSSWMARNRRPSARPDRLRLVPAGGPAGPGDLVDVMIGADFAGLALVTVETDRIHQPQLVELGIGGGMVTVRIPDEVRDTCFVAATLVRPLDPGSGGSAPLIARGVARIKIDREPHRLQTEIVASDSARPGEMVHLELGVTDSNSGTSVPMVHLWAVEEGALLVTDHHAPDLAEHFLKDRRRKILAANTLVGVLPEYDRSEVMGRIGGDRAASRREPVPVRIPEVRVLWRTTIPLPADGRLGVDLEMPELDGAMRVMAVVIDGDRYGSTEHVIGVTPSLQMTAAFPRAAAPGDSMRIPVRLRNNTSGATTARIDVEAGDGLDASIETASVVLDPSEEIVLELEIEATGIGSIPISIGATPIEVDSSPLAPSSTRLDRHIAVRPPHGRSSEELHVVVRPGERVDLIRDHDLEGLDGSIELVVTARPDTDLGGAIDGLIEYPYGCGEQLGSTIGGLLAALSVDPSHSGRDPESIRTMAETGFRKLWRIQCTDGSIPYWSGKKGDDWLTVRTAAIAQEADRLGISLPPEFLDGLVAATANRIRKSSTRDIQPLAVRVLTDAGRIDAAMLQVVTNDSARFAIGDRAQIAHTLEAIGRTDDAERIFDSITTPELSPPTVDGRFDSDVVQASLALNVLMSHRPDHPLIVPMLDFILSNRHDGRWRTTYETAAAVKAVAAWSDRHPADEVIDGEILIGGESVLVKGPELVRRRFELPAGTSLQDADEFAIAKGDASIHLNIVTSGIPTRGPSVDVESNGIEIERRWIDAEGEPIASDAKIAAGDLVVVEVEYASTFGRDVPNVAIVEILPGGMEFELPILVTSAAEGGGSDAVDRSEFRDDRLILFDTVTKNRQIVRYTMRAVVPGSWSVPGASATSMYVDAIEARTRDRKVEIILP